MPIRLKKFVGTILIIVFVVVYALVAMVIGNIVVETKSGLAQFFYFVIAGTLWVVPAGALIWWMQRVKPKA